MQHKRKKVSRKRGSETHGHGSSKKRRGAGHRGGKGKAGSGKRGDSKLMRITGGRKDYLGKHGFTPVNRKIVKTVNINHIQQKLDTLLSEEKIEKQKDSYVIDLDKLGYDKLLSKGEVTSKLKIKVKKASSSVIDKVKKAGGEVILSEKKSE
ncbi:50S ribosomal protein L15 [Candidatus Woesearchaeota archaeon]|nr:50S ribosomal protein L15 [Candidatus Woesearchaeota archaeon]